VVFSSLVYFLGNGKLKVSGMDAMMFGASGKIQRMTAAEKRHQEQ
jgi:hypothetical protein